MTRSNTIDVRPVASKNDLGAFINVTHAIFKDDPNWVAPLGFERREHLSPKHNPYFEHAEAQLFVAYKGSEAVGRVSAQIDQLRLDRYGDNYGQFGFLDAVDDEAVFKALLATAERWLKGRGMVGAKGPFSHSINEETGPAG